MSCALVGCSLLGDVVIVALCLVCLCVGVWRFGALSSWFCYWCLVFRVSYALFVFDSRLVRVGYFILRLAFGCCLPVACYVLLVVVFVVCCVFARCVLCVVWCALCMCCCSLCMVVCLVACCVFCVVCCVWLVACCVLFVAGLMVLFAA